MNRNPVTASLADPYQLELLYREDPDQFIMFFQQAIKSHPKAQILQFWKARLQHRPEADAMTSVVTFRQLRLLLVLCLSSFLVIKLPELLSLDPEWFLTRFAPFTVLAALTLFFARIEHQEQATLLKAGAGFIVVALVLLMLPDHRSSDSVTMGLLHAPLVLWCLLGLVFASGQWRSIPRRVDYLRYMGELFILTVLVLMGGMVMTGVTLGLFDLIGLDIEDWYMQNIGAAGAVSAPVVATFLYEFVLQRQSRFAITIANVFTPLFLLTIIAYLVTMVVAQKSPFSDREFLIIFNGLLLLVLGMTVFSICGRNPDEPSRLTDGINAALLAVTLIVDIVALSAIVYRLSEWGLTPNRVVVLGVNLLIFIHLLVIMGVYLRGWRSRGSLSGLTRACVGFLPVYGIWSLAVMILLPLMFRFQ